MNLKLVGFVRFLDHQNQKSKWAFSITCCPLSVNFSFYSSQPLDQIKLNLDVIADILWMVLLLNYVRWPCSTSTSLIAAMSFTWLKLPKLCLLTLSISLYVWLNNFNCAELPYISDISKLSNILIKLHLDWWNMGYAWFLRYMYLTFLVPGFICIIKWCFSWFPGIILSFWHPYWLEI